MKSIIFGLLYTILEFCVGIGYPWFCLSSLITALPNYSGAAATSIKLRVWSALHLVLVQVLATCALFLTWNLHISC